jgi:hypothetical protein
VTNVQRESHLEDPMTIFEVKSWLTLLLHEFAQIVWGVQSIGYKPPDQKFIEALESSLRTPIQLNYDALANLYKKDHFRFDLDKMDARSAGVDHF